MTKSVSAIQDDVALYNVMKATGLSEKETRELLLMSDDDLDNLCDTALSDVNQPSKKVPIQKRAVRIFGVVDGINFDAVASPG